MALHLAPHPDDRGTLHAHLFENTARGIARGLFWMVTLPCAPVIVDREEWEASLSCEWLRWPVRDWTGLDGMSLDVALDAETVECAVYLGEHHEARLASLTLTRVSGTPRFRVRAVGTVDLEGFDEIGGPALPFSIDAEVDVGGLNVVPENLFPKPATPAEAAAVLAPFISLDHLGPPEWDRFRYVFAPEVDEASGP